MQRAYHSLSKLCTHKQWLLPLLLILGGALIRLNWVGTPVLDWHAWRQADTASVTYEYVQHGVDLLAPTFHDISNIPSGEFNPAGYRMVEFPIVNALQAWLLRAIPALPFTSTLRAFAIGAGVISMIALYDLVKQLSGRHTALWSLAAFAVLPFSIFYTRVVLPEPYVIMGMTVSLAAFIRWLQVEEAQKTDEGTSRRLQSWGWYSLSLLALIVTFLLKPFVAFFAPVYAALIWYFSDWKRFFDWRIWLYGIIAVLPFGAWRWWIQRYPAGIPANDWLFNGDGIRFRPAWARWLFYERITKLIFGWLGAGIVLLNLLRLHKRDTWVYAAWWLSALLYFSVIATGNVRHDYYQAILIPLFAISLGRGLQISTELYETLREKNAWLPRCGGFNTNHPEYRAAGMRVREVVPADAQIIAPAMGDTQFLFQTRRSGWPIGFSIDEKIDRGAAYYVTTSLDDEAHELMEKYRILEQTQQFVIIDLTAPAASESATPAATITEDETEEQP